jgi:hypothetical protein
VKVQFVKYEEEYRLAGVIAMAERTVITPGELI